MKPDPQADIRAAFKERRLRLGLTESGMADMLAIHKLAYRRIEQSTRLTPEIRRQVDLALKKLEAEMRQQIT